MKRFLSLFALAALVVLPACSAGDPRAAAVVNGTAISTARLMDDVEALGSSPSFAQQLSSQGVTVLSYGPSRTGDPRSASMAFTTQWLGSLIQAEAVSQIAEQRGVTVTDEELTRTEAQMAQSAGPVWAELPKSFRDDLVEAQALQSALRAALPQGSANAAMDQAYAALEADCPSGLLIAHILVGTEAEAEAVIERLDAGEDFRAVSAEVSTDAGAAQRGGLLTCVDSSQWSQLDATFAAAAEQLGPDEVSPPVTTQFGVHVIKALPLTPANALPIVQATAQPPDPLEGVLRRWLRRHDVWVASRYGTVVRDPDFTLAPPTPAQVRSLPTPEPTNPEGTIGLDGAGQPDAGQPGTGQPGSGTGS